MAKPPLDLSGDGAGRAGVAGALSKTASIAQLYQAGAAQDLDFCENDYVCIHAITWSG